MVNNDGLFYDSEHKHVMISFDIRTVPNTGARRFVSRVSGLVLESPYLFSNDVATFTMGLRLAHLPWDLPEPPFGD